MTRLALRPGGWLSLVAVALALAAGLLLANLAAAGDAGPLSPAAMGTTAAYMPNIPHTAGGPTATPAPTAVPVTPPATGDWRTRLSYYRAAAHLPPLAENTGWSSDAYEYACYVVEYDQFVVTPGTGLPCDKSAAARAAPPNSLVLAGEGQDITDRQALDTWMSWPFHAVTILDPELTSTGFGSYRNFGSTGLQVAAILDVKRGQGALPPEVRYPVRWPDQNAAVYLTSNSPNEYPSPQSHCPGYAGLPIILQLGTGGIVTPTVTFTSLRQGTTFLQHCVFDESTYTSTDPKEQETGRAILASRDAVMLVPRLPLVPGASYTASIVANGEGTTWSFTVVNPP